MSRRREPERRKPLAKQVTVYVARGLTHQKAIAVATQQLMRSKPGRTYKSFTYDPETGKAVFR